MPQLQVISKFARVILTLNESEVRVADHQSWRITFQSRLLRQSEPESQQAVSGFHFTSLLQLGFGYLTVDTALLAQSGSISRFGQNNLI